jgi:predicted aldo/keto reductase-like oxidoreductase
MKKTGDRLSVLGFGCMRLPQKKGKIDEERAIKQIHYAIDQGVNYIDTAVPYHMGASEPFLGRALSDGYRDRVKLATKLPHWQVKKREDMDKILDAQLNRLNTDHIDYYLIHSLQGESWERMKALGLADFLEKCKNDGRITHAGFSSHAPKEEFKTIVDGYDWTFCLIQYNYLDEENQAGTAGLKHAASKNLGIIVMEPLRGGKLAGPIPPAIDSIWKEAETKRSPAEWALRWVWNHPEVTVVLSGMNEEAHIEENLRIANEAHSNSLTEEDLQLVSRVGRTYRQLMTAACTGCGYCMPCPAGVNIPGCFELYNNSRMFSDRQAKFGYLFRAAGITEGKPAFASLCNECGKCVDACPQSLPIPEMLKDVAKEFEGLGFKLLVWYTKRFMAFDRWRTLRRSGRQGR